MDDEVTSMFQMAKILDGLDEEARGRLIRWAADKYGVDVGQPEETNAAAAVLTAAGQSMFMDVDPDKVAAARAARAASEAGDAAAAELEVQPASTLEAEEAPPERDPEKPSFLDTSFRMYSGKKELKKAKDDSK